MWMEQQKLSKVERRPLGKRWLAWTPAQILQLTSWSSFPPRLLYGLCSGNTSAPPGFLNSCLDGWQAEDKDTMWGKRPYFRYDSKKTAEQPFWVGWKSGGWSSFPETVPGHGDSLDVFPPRCAFQNASFRWHSCSVRPHSFPGMCANLITSFFHAWKLLCSNPLTSAKPGKMWQQRQCSYWRTFSPFRCGSSVAYLQRGVQSCVTYSCSPDQLRVRNGSFLLLLPKETRASSGKWLWLHGNTFDL